MSGRTETVRRVPRHLEPVDNHRDFEFRNIHLRRLGRMDCRRARIRSRSNRQNPLCQVKMFETIHPFMLTWHIC